jgi:hypothetical protein
MKRFAVAIFLLISTAAAAQQSGPAHSSGMSHHAASGTAAPAGVVLPKEVGQSAFAAIQEIVALLEADPRTDWSKVDIEALRRHLIDMSNVTLHAEVEAEPILNGMRFIVTGKGPVRDSIRRMVKAHAETMSGTGGWTYAATERPDGAILTVTVPSPVDLVKLRALGFIGVMARGTHHQQHHLMIATGGAVHH